MKFSFMRAKILRIIRDNEPLTISELSRLIGISNGTSTTRYLKELEKQGNIVLYKDPTLRRTGRPTFIRTTSKADPLPRKFFKMLEGDRK